MNALFKYKSDFRRIAALLTFMLFFRLIAAQDFLRYKYDLSKLLDTIEGVQSIDLKIIKSEYKLVVLANNNTVKEYPVVFGGNPIDDKLKQGDLCTPEGTFSMRAKYPHRSWSKFIWIDYPNKQSWLKHNAAKQTGGIPKNASIGGEIGIHGTPEGMSGLIDNKTNWTLGCISLKNKDINEIYPFVTKKSSIEIIK